MSQVNLSCVCVLLVMILFQNIHFSEGRKLKNHKKNENFKMTFSTSVPKLTASMSSSQLSEAKNEAPAPFPAHADGFRPTAPGHSPGIGHSFPNLKMTMSIDESIITAPLSPPPPAMVVDEPRSPSPAYADGFRPTKPGHSPGVGHFFKDKRTITSASMTLPSLTQEVEEPRTPSPSYADGFRPTEPGHSPGIGHSLQNQKTISSADEDESQTPSPSLAHGDGFRPTMPGHSPGIGH